MDIFVYLSRGIYELFGTGFYDSIFCEHNLSDVGIFHIQATEACARRKQRKRVKSDLKNTQVHLITISD